MVEALGITIIDRCPKGRPRKRGSQTIEKTGCVLIGLAGSTGPVVVRQNHL